MSAFGGLKQIKENEDAANIHVISCLNRQMQTQIIYLDLV